MTSCHSAPSLTRSSLAHGHTYIRGTPCHVALACARGSLSLSLSLSLFLSWTSTCTTSLSPARSLASPLPFSPPLASSLPRASTASYSYYTSIYFTLQQERSAKVTNQITALLPIFNSNRLFNIIYKY